MRVRLVASDGVEESQDRDGRAGLFVKCPDELFPFEFRLAVNFQWAKGRCVFIAGVIARCVDCRGGRKNEAADGICPAALERCSRG